MTDVEVTPELLQMAKEQLERMKNEPPMTEEERLEAMMNFIMYGPGGP